MAESLEIPGFRPQWTKDCKKNIRVAKELCDQFEKHDRQKFKRYAVAGVLEIGQAKENPPNVHPPFEEWQRGGPSLSFYAYTKLRQFQIAVTESGKVSEATAKHVFSAAYLHGVSEIYMAYVRPARFDGINLPFSHLNFAFFSALGVILGCQPQSDRLARAFCRMAGLGYFGWKQIFPTHVFVNNLLADFFGEKGLSPKGRVEAYPSYWKILNEWRDPDTNKIAGFCVMLCDLHSQLAYKQRDDWEGDFLSDSDFHVLPVEVLLMLKLRQRLGLNNPEIDHPVLNTPFGELHKLDLNFEMDDLLQGVHARMVRKGFDEERIFQCIMNDEYASARGEKFGYYS